MSNTIRRILAALSAPTPQELEHKYLNAAEDRYDLEWRQRQIDRGLFRPRTMLGGLPAPG
jgi:hypothetical protein